MKRAAAVLWFCVVSAIFAQTKPVDRPVRLASRGTHGAAAGSDPAVEAGMRIFHAGGNAVDADIAAMLAAVFEYAIEFGVSAEEAVEAPRFQTRHLVSGFDDHDMRPGDLPLDERIPPATGDELARRKHDVGTRSHWASGAAPVLIRLTPNGVIEAGADPYGRRSARSW